MQKMNEGEYLELVNDLKKQYDSMKEIFTEELNYYKLENRILKFQLGYHLHQFASPRPSAPCGVYTSEAPDQIIMSRSISVLYD